MRSPSRVSERGVALAVALIMLVVLTLLALSGVRLSTMELRMALGDEIRVNAFEQAQSAVDSTIRLFSNTPVLAPDVVICAKLHDTMARECDDARVTMPTEYHAARDANLLNVVIQRIRPMNAEPPPGTGFSINQFDAAFLQVAGLYDNNAAGLGAAQVNEGVAVVYGASGELLFSADEDEFSGADPPPPAPPPEGGDCSTTSPPTC